jgi:hypothetical protein
VTPSSRRMPAVEKSMRCGKPRSDQSQGPQTITAPA